MENMNVILAIGILLLCLIEFVRAQDPVSNVTDVNATVADFVKIGVPII